MIKSFFNAEICDKDTLNYEEIGRIGAPIASRKQGNKIRKFLICLFCNGFLFKKKIRGVILRIFFWVMWPRQESNLDPELRKLIYYPLYYEAKNVLFGESNNVGSKYFYRNGEQNYAEKLSHHY